MRRREFITLVGGSITAWPLAASGQQAEQLRRIGVMMALKESDPEAQARIKVFQQGLDALGWTLGKKIRIDYQYAAAGPEQIRSQATQLIAFNPDVLLAENTPYAQELQRQTKTIPIVGVTIGDPVDSGLVPSLSRPGGNVTGLMLFEPSIGGKWLDVLKEAAPGINRVLVLVNAGNAANASFLRMTESAAPSVGVRASSLAVADLAKIDPAIETIAREGNAGLIVNPGAPINDYRKMIFASAQKHRVPAVYPYRYFATDGGLLSYGAVPIDNWRRAVFYVDRILKGEKAGNLPVQAPTKFELVINLKSAKAIGLTIPPLMLTRADEVIE